MSKQLRETASQEVVNMFGDVSMVEIRQRGDDVYVVQVWDYDREGGAYELAFMTECMDVYDAVHEAVAIRSIIEREGMDEDETFDAGLMHDTSVTYTAYPDEMRLSELLLSDDWDIS